MSKQGKKKSSPPLNNVQRGAVRMAPVATSTLQRNQQRGQQPSVVHTRKELVKVYSVPATAVTEFDCSQAFTLNPGLVGTFPWISEISKNFELYKFRKLKITYEPGCPSTLSGMIAIVPAVDVYNKAPLNWQEAYAFENSVQGSLWRDMTCEFNLREGNLTNNTARFIRSDQVAGDLKTYDTGLFWICTTGVAANTFLGTIFVEYTVELIEPVPPSANKGVVLKNLFLSSSNGQFTNVYTSPSSPVVPTELAMQTGGIIFSDDALTQQTFCKVVDVTAGSTSYKVLKLARGTYRCRLHWYVKAVPLTFTGQHDADIVVVGFLSPSQDVGFYGVALGRTYPLSTTTVTNYDGTYTTTLESTFMFSTTGALGSESLYFGLAMTTSSLTGFSEILVGPEESSSSWLELEFLTSATGLFADV